MTQFVRPAHLKRRRVIVAAKMVTPSDCKLYVQTIQSASVRTLVEVMKELLRECNIVATEDGLSVVSVCSKKCSIVSLKLDASKFEEYYCPEEMHLGVEMLNLFKLIKTVTTTDLLTLYVTKADPNQLGIEIENTDKRIKTTFELKLLEIDYDELTIGDADFESVITIPSAFFQSLMRNMSNIGEYVTIRSKGDCLQFICDGDVASQTTEVGETCGTGAMFTKSTSDVIEALYALKYLVIFTKATALSNTLELLMKNDYPMIILRYAVATLGELRLCLTSRVQDV